MIQWESEIHSEYDIEMKVEVPIYMNSVKSTPHLCLTKNENSLLVASDTKLELISLNGKPFLKKNFKSSVVLAKFDFVSTITDL